MPGTNLTRDEAATRASLLDVTSYSIDLDLTTSDTTFGSTTTIVFSCREPGASTFADLVGATIHEITLNGEPVDASAYADSRIALSGLAAENTLVVRADCTYSRTGEGLHRFVDPADDRVYLYSQFEVPDARRVYTTFEQPDLKAPYTFTVTTPAGWAVSSNAATPEPEDAASDDGQSDKQVWRFPETQPMSTYITALVAGEYHSVHRTYTGAHGEIPMGLYCRQSLVEHLDADELWKITEQGFGFFEEKFGYPYPFGKYDQLFVPEYNMGAMENAGCVTFRDEYLPRSRQDRSFYEFRAEVILHEMAHMWFGDLVTMRWWDDLWLNESFAEWACYHAAVNATEFTESWTGFTNARKNWAYRQDQLPSTHPIAADNYDLQAVEVNFDGITYAKGASVLKQLVAWVGLDPFLEGLRGYFEDFAFSNAEFKDLLMALEKASGRELESWAQEWLQTAGVNTLAPEFELAEDGTYASFAIRQTAAADYPTLRRHRLGVGLYDKVEGRLVRRTSVETDVEGELSEVAPLVGEKQPDLLLLNDGDLAYAKIRLDERSLDTLVTSIETIDDSLARALCWGAAWDMTRDAEMSASDFVTLVLSGIASETDAFGVNRLPGYAATAATLYSAPEHRSELRDKWESGLRGLLMTAEPGDDHQLSFARAYAVRRAHRPGARRPRGAARRLARDRRPRGRHRPALDAAVRAGQERPGRRRPDRRGAGPRQHHLRQGARRGRPHPHPHRRGQGRGVGAGDGPRRRPQRDPAQHRAGLPGLRPGRGARAVRREVPRRRRHHVGGEGHPARLDRAGVHLPQAAGQPGAPRPGRRLAGELTGQPRRQALRPRGSRRRRPGAAGPGEGRGARLNY